MLFNLFKKSNTPTNTQSVELTYTLSDHFRGYKAFPMVVQGHEVSEKNNAALKGAKLSGRKITFKLCKSKDNLYYFDVLLDGAKIGAIFDKGHMRELQTNQITAVYAKNDTETIVAKEGIFDRNRIHLFVKYKEG